MTKHRGQINIRGRSIKEIRFDVDFGCLYLLFTHEQIAKTVEHSHGVNVDLDHKGELVGLEFIGVKKAKGNFKQIFVELADAYRKPELKKIPAELKQDLSFVA